jgi:hypothetical protein
MKLGLSNPGRLKVFQSRVLRIFGHKKDEVTVEWRRLHNEVLHELYCSPNIIRVITSRMGWVRHVARMGRREVHIGFWWGNLRLRKNLEDLGVDGRIILRWIFWEWDVRLWIGWSWFRIGTDGGHL